MRRRAKSCFVDTGDLELVKKFEGVADNDGPDEEDESEYESDAGTEPEVPKTDKNCALTLDDVTKIINVLRAHTSEKEKIPGINKLKKLKWDEIDFGLDKNTDIRAFCTDIVKQIRKSRNLNEMLGDFEDAFKNQFKPKRPKSIYMVFTEKHYHEIKQKNPNLSSPEIMKLLSQMYKELDEDEMDELRTIADEDKERYVSDKQKFKENRPRKSTPGKQKIRTPFGDYFQSVKKKMSYKDAKKVFHDMPFKEKIIWIQQVHQSKDNEDDRKIVITKEETKLLQSMDGKPEFVGLNRYAYYMKTRMEDLSNSGLSKSEVHQKILAEYRTMSASEMAEIKKEYLKAKERYIEEYREYLKKLPSEAYDKEILFLNKVINGSKKMSEGPKQEPSVSDQSDGEAEKPAKSQLKKEKVPAQPRKRAAPKKKKTVVKKAEDKQISDYGEDDSDIDSGKDNTPKKSISDVEPEKENTRKTIVKPHKRKLIDSSDESTTEVKKRKDAPGELKKEITSKQKKASQLKSPEGKSENIKETVKAEDENNVPCSTSLMNGTKTPVKSPSKKKDNANSSSLEAKQAVVTSPSKKENVENKKLAPPEKPPTNLQAYFERFVYKGPASKCEKAYKKLTKNQRDEINVEFKKTKDKYLTDLKAHLLALPKEEFQKTYLKATKKEESEESDED